MKKWQRWGGALGIALACLAATGCASSRAGVGEHHYPQVHDAR